MSLLDPGPCAHRVILNWREIEKITKIINYYFSLNQTTKLYYKTNFLIIIVLF